MDPPGPTQPTQATSGLCLVLFHPPASFGTSVPNPVPKDQGDLKATKESPEVACVGCVGRGGSITNSHAAEIKPIAAKVAENDHLPC